MQLRQESVKKTASFDCEPQCLHGYKIALWLEHLFQLIMQRQVARLVKHAHKGKRLLSPHSENNRKKPAWVLHLFSKSWGKWCGHNAEEFIPLWDEGKHLSLSQRKVHRSVYFERLNHSMFIKKRYWGFVKHGAVKTHHPKTFTIISDSLESQP